MSGKMEYMELNEDSKAEQLRHAETLRKFEAQRKARSVIVPTAVQDIKQKLRELGQPITLFGEDHADRRNRLREVIAQMGLEQEELDSLQAIMNRSTAAPKTSAGDSAKGPVQKEVIYTPATVQLIAARESIALFSFAKAHERITRIKRIRENDQVQESEDSVVRELYLHSRDLVLNSSQFADERPLTCVKYSADAAHIASASMGAAVKIWKSDGLGGVGVLRGHTDRITSLAWHPQAETAKGTMLLASSSGDGSCNLWDCRRLVENSGMDDLMQQDPTDDDLMKDHESLSLQSSFKGHQGVVACCDFHPSGAYIATASYDFTWRLWDVEVGVELLLQDGHLKDCNVVAFHPDGSLVLSADSGGVTLLWDLRSGQNVQAFQGHIKKITGASFNANGFQAATCSVDNTVKVWDLRKKKCSYTLPAHSNAITDLQFSKSGELLLTSSFDATLKIWSARDYSIQRTLSGHEGKVMGCDFASDERHVISAGFDRTIKLWAHKDEF